jgi:DNA gyrase inhibitor GyrI
LSELASSEKTITDIALNCGYQSHEAFTRAFSKEFGQTPMQYRSGNRLCRGIHALKLIEETVMGLTIKHLEAIPVARYRVISAAPEADAWSHLSKWAEQGGLFEKPYRCFGYNRPNPFEVKGHEMLDEGEYGYEVLLSFDASLQPRYPSDGRGVREGLLKGGRYAVLGIGVNCEEQDIERGWVRMTELLKASDYKTTGYWFEEHLEFNPEAGQLPSRMDLYVQLEDTQ